MTPETRATVPQPEAETLEERRFRYVDTKAMRLVTAAGLEGEAAEGVRKAVHANHEPILQRFRAGDSLAQLRSSDSAIISFPR